MFKSETTLRKGITKKKPTKSMKTIKKHILKKTTRTVHEVDYQDLNDFVHKVYPEMKDYHFVTQQECGNDCCFQFDTNSGSTDQDERFPKISNCELFAKLAEDGHIEHGDYIVNVCW